ncbi:MAG: hypothetical protein JNK04_12245, partial [Myxococcales bacterium]|nr:hypothetical protein [Myxococcales bacterium]
EGKNVGNFPAGTQSKVFTFLKKAEELQAAKEELQNSLGSIKEKLETSWKKQDKPQYEWGVIFSGGGTNYVAELVGIKEPWDKGTELAKDKKIVILSAGQDGKVQEREAARYEKDLVAQTPVAFPIRPESMGQFTNERIAQNVQRVSAEIRVILSGDETPGREKPGFIKTGEDLAGELEKLALRR